MKSKRAKELIIYSILASAGLITYFFLMPLNENTIYYSTVLLAYAFAVFVIGFILAKRKIYMFEPLVMVSLLYFFIMIIRPLQDMITGDILTDGVYTYDGCIKGTLVFCISFFSFIVGYELKNRKKNPGVGSESQVKNIRIGKQELVICLVIWTFSYLMVLLYLFSQGKDLIYILSFGLFGNVNDALYNSKFKFLAQFSFSAIAPWFIYLVYGKKKIIKIVLSVLTVNLFLIRGTRIVLLGVLLVPVIYHYIKNGKVPKITTIVMIGVSILILFSIIQYSRYSMRHGYGMDAVQTYTLQSVFNVFNADFTTYKQLYGVVVQYPARHEYTYGRQMFLFTITQFIPRAIWPTKPDGVLFEVLSNSVTERVALTGVAFPNFGEYYYEFGIVGCVVFQFILGRLFSEATRLYSRKNISSMDIIQYAILYVVMFNTIIRCNTSSAVFNYLFGIAPIFLIKKMKKEK